MNVILQCCNHTNKILLHTKRNKCVCVCVAETFFDCRFYRGLSQRDTAVIFYRSQCLVKPVKVHNSCHLSVHVA